jgi:hypothetical protein
VFSAAFLFFGLWPLHRRQPIRLWCLVLSAAFLIVSLAAPSLLHAANRVWTRIGLLLGRVLNPVVTGLLFYLVFTPGALVLRWLGKDPLRLRFDTAAETYWIERDARQNASAMTDQF